VLTFLYSAALVAQHYQSAESAPLRGQLQGLTQRFCDARPTFEHLWSDGMGVIWTNV